jgi:hypothetical protein
VKSFESSTSAFAGSHAAQHSVNGAFSARDGPLQNAATPSASAPSARREKMRIPLTLPLAAAAGRHHRQKTGRANRPNTDTVIGLVGMKGRQPSRPPLQPVLPSRLFCLVFLLSETISLNTAPVNRLSTEPSQRAKHRTRQTRESDEGQGCRGASPLQRQRNAAGVRQAATQTVQLDRIPF